MVPAAGHHWPLTSLASSQLAELGLLEFWAPVSDSGALCNLLAQVSCVYTSGGSAWGLFDVGDGEGQFLLCSPDSTGFFVMAITPVWNSQKVAHKEGLACV